MHAVCCERKYLIRQPSSLPKPHLHKQPTYDDSRKSTHSTITLSPSNRLTAARLRGHPQQIMAKEEVTLTQDFHRAVRPAITPLPAADVAVRALIVSSPVATAVVVRERRGASCSPLLHGPRREVLSRRCGR